MTAEVPEVPEVEVSEDEDPIFFAPKRVTAISDIANILSWIFLVACVIQLVVEIIGLRSQLSGQGVTLKALLREPSLYTYVFQRMIIPVLTGLGFFAVLQGVSLGLSMLLEADFNSRESATEVVITEQ